MRRGGVEQLEQRPVAQAEWLVIGNDRAAAPPGPVGAPWAAGGAVPAGGPSRPRRWPAARPDREPVQPAHRDQRPGRGRGSGGWSESPSRSTARNSHHRFGHLGEVRMSAGTGSRRICAGHADRTEGVLGDAVPRRVVEVPRSTPVIGRALPTEAAPSVGEVAPAPRSVMRLDIVRTNGLDGADVRCSASPMGQRCRDSLGFSAPAHSAPAAPAANSAPAANAVGRSATGRPRAGSARPERTAATEAPAAADPRSRSPRRAPRGPPRPAAASRPGAQLLVIARSGRGTSESPCAGTRRTHSSVNPVKGPGPAAPPTPVAASPLLGQLAGPRWPPASSPNHVEQPRRGGLAQPAAERAGTGR